jgi:hypothetical protein
MSSLGGMCCPLGTALFSPEDRRMLGWLSQLWVRPGRDALLLLRRWLKEALRAERLQPATRSKLTSAVAPGELLTLAQALAAQPGAGQWHVASSAYGRG